MKRKIVICISIAVGIALLVTGTFVLRKQQMVHQLSNEVFRFHVLANSDNEKDQTLKMQVKEAIIAYMKEEIPDAKSAKETKEWAQNHLTELEDVATDLIREKGYRYAVKAEVLKCYFPEKVYGDITFPHGKYDALRIKIGAAKGKNWWCVLYPNLCFVDATYAVVPKEGKEELQHVLDEETYDMITEKPKFKIRWFFFS